MHAIPTKISQVPPPLSQTKFIYFACQEHFSCLFTDDSSYYFKGQLKTSSITRSTTHMHQTNTNTCYLGRRHRVIKCRLCFFSSWFADFAFCTRGTFAVCSSHVRPLNRNKWRLAIWNAHMTYKRIRLMPYCFTMGSTPI